MRWSRVTRFALPLFAILSAALVAQQPTLRELIAQSHSGVALMVNSDGPPVKLDHILDQTDFIVRAVVGEGVGHLSANGNDIYTTYPLLNVRVLFAAVTFRSGNSGETAAAFTLSQRGGTIMIDGFNATVNHDDVRALTPGTDIVALLHQQGGLYWPAGGYAVFTSTASKISAAYPPRGEHRKFDGMDTDQAVSELVELRKARPR